MDRHQRFQGVLIENRPAIEVMRQHDAPTTLHYVDPPYTHATRHLRNGGCYRYEMTNEDHAELLLALHKLEGMVVVSSYDSALYRDMLSGWATSRPANRSTKLLMMCGVHNYRKQGNK